MTYTSFPQPTPPTTLHRCKSTSRPGAPGWPPPSRPPPASAERAARHFVASVFRDVRLPDVIVSDRDTRFAGAWTGLHAALGASLIFGSPPHQYRNTGGASTASLQSACTPLLPSATTTVQLVEFVSNEMASFSGFGYTLTAASTPAAL